MKFKNIGKKVKLGNSTTSGKWTQNVGLSWNDSQQSGPVIIAQYA